MAASDALQRDLARKALDDGRLAKLAEERLDTLRAAEASGKPIVAVDLPSGLSGDLGRPLDFAPRCALTVTFHRKKPAHVLEPGHGLCGEVVVVDIGLTTTPTKLFENGPRLWAGRFPWPTAASHKHARGRLVRLGPVLDEILRAHAYPPAIEKLL